MPKLTRSQIQTLGILICILLGLGFLVFERLSPSGIFADLQNDLKDIQKDETPLYTDLDGNLVDLRTFKGKPLVINSWATWMPFSQTELPLLEKMHTTYGYAVTILAINRMETTPVIRSFMETFGIAGDVLFLNDPSDNFYKAVGGYAMPETVFYNADGTIHQHTRGVLTEVELNNAIQVMIQAK